MIKKLIATFTALSIMITPIQSFALKVDKQEMNQTLNSTVIISVTDKLNATGWITKYKDKYYIVTGAHVIMSAKNQEMINFTLYNGNKSIAFVKYLNVKNDVCIMEVVNKVLINNNMYLDIASEKPERLEDVYYCGNPSWLTYTTAKGYFSGEDRLIYGFDVLFDQYFLGNVYSGSSGSAILNDNNEVVGMISSKTEDGEFVFSVPAQEIADVLKIMSLTDGITIVNK